MKRIITGVLATIFLGTMFFSLFLMSFEMEMARGMRDCPFTAEQGSICTMNLADHMSSWQSLFVVVVPSLTLLFALVVFIHATLPLWLQGKRLSHLTTGRIVFQRDQTYTFFVRPLQEFFASGLLHPKLF